jgi:hypothetical protein
MQYVPFGLVIAGLGVCLGALLTGLVMMYTMGGWGAMMQPIQGRWSLSRRLVYGGSIGFVVFNCLLTLLTWIPGALPFR